MDNAASPVEQHEAAPASGMERAFSSEAMSRRDELELPGATAYIDRFVGALGLLCRRKPTRELCEQWLNHENDDLQSWAIDNRCIYWQTGIGAIEAAQHLADNPEEGEGHEGFTSDYARDTADAQHEAAPAGEMPAAYSPLYVLRGIYKPAIEYFIDGEPCTPDEYIAWQAGIIEAVTKAKLPDPKYYGGYTEDGDQHDVKCAYVDGWNDCRNSILTSHPAPSAPLEGTGNGAFERAAYAYPTIDHWLTEIAGDREVGHIVSEMTHMEVARQAWCAARASASQPAAAAGQEAVAIVTETHEAREKPDLYTIKAKARLNIGDRLYTAPPAQVATRQGLTERQRMDLLLVADDMEVSGDAKLADALRALLKGDKQ
ncbi:hypothetical protein [Burkholderia sp. BCC0398]|uniref:hypothetical protein n=1 Tax=Burkholderia sp. BCC0398 TaxID=2676297 RepID=UPI00158991FA|nr:hypothetical protein [Burkholderia sp. BCC0398]